MRLARGVGLPGGLGYGVVPGRSVDSDVRSPTYLDTTTYPDITFTCHQLRQQADKWVAAGTVTAHGATAPVDVTLIDLTQEGGT